MTKKALIVVDVQNDFLPGGTLPVPRGDEVIPYINRMLQLPFDQIIATRDFHPEKHSSFASSWNKRPGERLQIGSVEQILWPEHCVQGSQGSEFAATLDTSHFHKVVHKGTDIKVDSYSTFFDNKQLQSTGLESYLHEQDIEELYFAGLATDYCVLYSVRDAISLGFTAYVVVDACRGVDLSPGDVQRAFDEMQHIGAHLITTEEVEQRFTQHMLTP